MFLKKIKIAVPFNVSYTQKKHMQELSNQETISKKEFPLYIKAFIVLVKLVGYSLAFIIATGLFSYIVILLLPNFDTESLQTGDLTDWKSNSLIQVGMLAGTFLVTYAFRVGIDNLPFATVGLQFNNVLGNLMRGAMYAIGILGLSFGILYLLGAIQIESVQFEPVGLLGYLLLFLLAAFVEELTVRGYMIPLIAKDFHFMSAILLSSLIFAVLHMANAHFTWLSFANIFLGGYLLGLIFYKKQELYTPLGLHWIWNYFQGNVLGFGVSGFQVESILSISQDGPDWLTGGEFGLEGSVVTTTILFIVSIYLTYKWYEEMALSQA